MNNLNTSGIARIAKALVVTFAALVAVAGFAPSAQAAGTSAPDLTFCLSYNNGAAYASKPVYLYRWNASTQKWVSYRNGSTNASGCGTWRDVAGNSYYYVQGYWTYTVGAQGYAYSGNTASVGVGTVWDGQYSTSRGYIGHYRLY